MTQAGVLRVESVKELFDYAEIFADPILPAGRRTAIITNAGGPGIMATDACIRNGMQLARFQEYTLKSLRYQMPPTANIMKPVDVIGDAKQDGIARLWTRSRRRRGRGPGDGRRYARPCPTLRPLPMSQRIKRL
jgi:acyl-CoA synthetase (NDP forming)